MGNFGDRGISALVTFVLAGIVGPRDFGLIAIAVIYINFAQMFLDQGLAAALIQKKDLEQEDCDSVFWLNLAVSLLFVALTMLLSGWWARINHAPDLARVLSVLSICIPIEGLSIVQSAVVRRELDFKTLTIRSNLSVFIGGVAGLGLAYAGYGVWALVGMQLVRDFSALLLLWRLGHWRPTFAFSWTHLQELLRFSVHLFVSGLGTFADQQAGAILLGVLFGPVAVGLYRLADRLVGSVVSIATTSIQGVSLPEFSRLQDRPEELKSGVIACIRLSSMATMPALVGMAITSGPLVATLGPKWTPATNVMKILCLQAIVFTLSYFTGPLLTAKGKTHQVAKLVWGSNIIGILFLLASGALLRNSSVDWQVMGIALAKAIPRVLVITPVFVYVLMEIAHFSLRDLVLALKSPLWASAGIVGVISLIHAIGVANWTRPAALLIIDTAIGGLAALGILVFLDKQVRGLALGLANRLGWFSTAVR